MPYSVTEEDLARLRRGYELHNAEDFASVGELMPTDIVIERVGGETIEGRDAAVAFSEPDAFGYQRLMPRELEVHGDKVLVELVVRAKGAASSIELEIDAWHVWTFSDGEPVHMVASFDEAEARARL